MHPAQASTLGSYDGCAANISVGPCADEPVGSLVAGLLVVVANKQFFAGMYRTHDDAAS